MALLPKRWRRGGAVGVAVSLALLLGSCAAGRVDGRSDGAAGSPPSSDAPVEPRPEGAVDSSPDVPADTAGETPSKPNGTACAAASECGSGFCAGGYCCATACTEVCHACRVGTCMPLIGADDPDSCSGTCDATGTCRKKTGDACASPADCVSGFCVDGFCCEEACAGTCRRCDRGMAGKCAPVAAGDDPDGDCGAYTCGEAGSCAGSCAGACAATCKPGKTCIAGACVDGQPAGSPCVAACDCASGVCTGAICCASACDGPCRTCAEKPGMCTPAPADTDPAGACAGGLTCDGAGSCRTECAADAHCRPGYHCTAAAGGTCEADRALGAACAGDPIDSTGGHQCASGFCADGVCCAYACGAPCERCNQPGLGGTCGAVPAGSDPDGECAGGYACDGARACRSSCTADTHCEPASYCDGAAPGACLPGKADGDACAADAVDPTGDHQCGSKVCSGGRCGACTDDEACSVGQVCTLAEGRCEPCMASTDQDGDGFVAARCGGGDCDDHAPTTHPGADDPADVALAGGLLTVYGHVTATTAKPQFGATLDASGKAWAFFRDATWGYFAVLRQDGDDFSKEIWELVTSLESPALALDSAGAAHLLYRKSGTLYHRTSVGSWPAGTALSPGGLWAHLEADGSDTLHAIGFSASGPSAALRYLRKPAVGAWAFETIDESAVTNHGSAGMDVTSDGGVHVSYMDVGSPSTLVHRWRASDGSWAAEPAVVATGTEWAGAYSALALDGAGRAHIGYVRSAGVDNRLGYATNAGGTWAATVIDSDIGAESGHTAIAAGAAAVHIAYNDATFAERRLEYATNLSGTWTVFGVYSSPNKGSSTGTYEPSIHLGPSGEPVVIFFSSFDKKIFLARLSVRNDVDQNCDGR